MENEIQAIPANGHTGAMMNRDVLLNPSSFNQIMEFAKVMATGSSTIPKHLQNVGDCMAVTIQALQWGMIPHVVAQKTHLVNGVLGYEAQLVHAVILASGVLAERPNYEYVGNWESIDGIDTKHGDQKENGLGIIVSARLKGESEFRTTRVMLSDCLVRNSPNWKRKRKQQISYVGIKDFVRQHAPDVLMGVYTEDEIIDSPRNINDRPNSASPFMGVNPGALSTAEVNPILAKIKACKSVDEVQMLKPDISMMKGKSRQEAIAACQARIAEFDIQGEAVHKKSFDEITAQINANPSSAPDFVAQELIAHLPVDQQAAITKLANTAFDKSMK